MLFRFCLFTSMFLGACTEKETEESSEDSGIEETTETPVEDDDELIEPEEVEEPEEESEIEEEPKIDVCSFEDQESTSHVLPASPEEAAQLTIIPGEGESYILTKEAAQEGWFVLEVPSWMCDVELYVPENVNIELEYTPDWELGDVAAPLVECEESGLYRYSWTFHAWGSYIIHIQAPEQTDIWLGSVLVINM